MKRIHILVEGQTEERFVKDILNPYYSTKEINFNPILAITKQVIGGPYFKGGITSYSQIEKDIKSLLNDSSAAAVTTFIDYYGLPSDFPGMAQRPKGRYIDRAIYVENAWREKINNPRFHPYLMIHEFEAMLFCKPEEIGLTLNQPGINNKLMKIRQSVTSPEEINEGYNTAPSKRIIKCTSAYQKTLHGPMIIGRIGLNPIRQQCPHFNDWLNWIENF